MASNSSGTLSPSQTYTLGDYTFQLIVTYFSTENITSVLCHVSNGTESAETGKNYTGAVTVKDWSVEANDKSADIYVHVYKASIDTSPADKPIVCDSTGYLHTVNRSSPINYDYSIENGTGKLSFVFLNNNKNYFSTLLASSTSSTELMKGNQGSESKWTVLTTSRSFTHDGKTVYYDFINHEEWSCELDLYPVCYEGIVSVIGFEQFQRIAWSMIYGDDGFDRSDLVARFEIDISDADGTSWDDPGSTGDVSKTLNVSVTGALSGRHNDPLNDTSYAYTPSEQDAATVYGSGGDGGHGGGGGAGASTVIIHTIATERAGSVDETAIAKRHGYGSGGGKGGKGADGCILVYY